MLIGTVFLPRGVIPAKERHPVPRHGAESRPLLIYDTHTPLNDLGFRVGLQFDLH